MVVEVWINYQRYCFECYLIKQLTDFCMASLKNVHVKFSCCKMIYNWFHDLIICIRLLSIHVTGFMETVPNRTLEVTR